MQESQDLKDALVASDNMRTTALKKELDELKVAKKE